MIGFLQGVNKGSIDQKKMIVLTELGIGYEVNVSEKLMQQEHVQFYVSCILKENSQDLYGFASLEEKKIFELLLSVNGVGPKSAFALMGFYESSELINYILMGDAAALKKAPGIGAKASQQIILDLEKKIKTLAIEPSAGLSDPLFEGLEVLRQLGFKDQEVLPALKAKMSHFDGKIELLVKEVLKEIRN